MVKKEISSVQHWKEAFWETALCSVNSSHRVTSFPSISLSLRLFLWNWQRDIWKPIEGYGEKGNIFRSKPERSCLRNCSVFCWFISQSYIIPFQKLFAKVVLVELVKGYLESHRGLWWKRKYLPFKTGKNLSEKLLCVLLNISQSYIFPFKKPFAKAVLVELAKGYLEALRGLWWKRKYLPFKTGKKLSEKLLCVLLIHLTELHLSLQEAFR